MRVDELVVASSGQVLRIGFHDRMTVLSGFDAAEREGLTDTLQRAAIGAVPGAELTYFDVLGRRVVITNEQGGPHVRVDDQSTSSAALPPPDISHLRRPALIGAADLGLGPRINPNDETPELTEARSLLATLEEELTIARLAEKKAEAAETELSEVEGRIRAAEQGAARRRYARVAARLEEVRAEADVLRGSGIGEETDRRTLRTAPELHKVANMWLEVRRIRDERAAAFGNRPRLDADTVRWARTVPEEAPADLQRLVQEVDDAELARDELSARLFEASASKLPDPSAPAVVDLARVDQKTLWHTHRAVRDARIRLDAEQLSLGGMGSSTEVESIVQQIDAAQIRVEQAGRRSRRLYLAGIAVGGIAGITAIASAGAFPIFAALLLILGLAVVAGALLLPQRRVRVAERAAAEALAKVDATSYLEFQLRRLDAVLDPTAKKRLEDAVADHRSASIRWHEIAGGISPERAEELEDEVTKYAQALGRLGGAAHEIEALRNEVAAATARAETARRRLIEACRPYGADDPGAAMEQVRQRIATGRIGRMQWELEEAERALAALEVQADHLCDAIGVAETMDTGARLMAAEDEVVAAERRDKARSTTRPSHEIDAELARLEQEERSLRPADGTSFTPDDLIEPDVPELMRTREGLLALVAQARAKVPDMTQLNDRHAAVARRVAALEEGSGLSESVLVDPSDLQERLLARLGRARHAAPDGGPLPAILDEPFLNVPAGHKWDLLDMVERLSEGSQIIYLTDDPYVAAWAKRRSDSGAIKLLAASQG
ncbi:MAG TPA: hypothetical protein VMK16_13960 [Acidimicrobiales bacterium]|nr:hypothetical protein [Acidimicrobiales bacterium]